MPNCSGEMYGLTVLSPIIDDPSLRVSHDAALRIYLQGMQRHEASPFSRIPGAHLCRLVVMDDVVFVGHPAREEHLKSKYLIFNSNLYGDPVEYLRTMAREIPAVVDAVWSHCVGYPGVESPQAFADYIHKCQIETTFFFADVNNQAVDRTLRALQMKVEFTAFVEENQGRPAAELQQEFARFWKRIQSMPAPLPGAKEPAARSAAAV